jgi:hypothetical protein
MIEPAGKWAGWGEYPAATPHFQAKPGPREDRLDQRRNRVGAAGRMARKEPPQAGMRAYRSRQRGSADQ